MRWFPVDFLANGVFIMTRAGFELTTSVLRARPLNYFITAPPFAEKHLFLARNKHMNICIAGPPSPFD